MVAILVLLTVIVFLTIDFYAQRAAARKAATVPARARPVAVRLPADLASLPGGVFLSPGHAWVGLEPSGALKIGADRLPATLLGGFDAVAPAAVGTSVHRGDPIARLSRAGRSVDLPSPVDGVVTAINPIAATDPEKLARGPLAESWIATVAPTRLGAALERLRVADEAVEWLRRELARLRDFMVELGERSALPAPTLADGGLPVAGIAARLGDAEWRRLVDRFFTVDAG